MRSTWPNQFNLCFFNKLSYINCVNIVVKFRVGEIMSAISLFWDVSQRRLLVNYRRLSTTYRSHLQVSNSPPLWPFKMAPIGCTWSLVINNLRCETSRKGADLIYIAAEASSHEIRSSIKGCLESFQYSDRLRGTGAKIVTALWQGVLRYYDTNVCTDCCSIILWTR